MPGLDKTGPEGKGSKTGRGMGTCTGKTTKPEINNEQENPELGKKSGMQLRMGRKGKGYGQGNRLRHRGGQDKQGKF